MKMLLNAATLLFLILCLSACCSYSGQKYGVKTTQLQHKPFAAYNPMLVEHLIKAPTSNQYQKIAKISVDNYNVFGYKRQDATINDILNHVAANMGGNALIDIKHTDRKTLATVIHLNNVS